MTACVDPSAGQYKLHRADPAVRLHDYESALRFWLHYRDERIKDILFIENSNYPLESIRRIAENENPRGCRVEFISLDCNGYPPGGHYGYAELKMLDLGFQQSALRQSTTHMIKVSGRLTFPALKRLLNRIPPDFDAVADARAYSGLFHRHARPNVTTQIILFRHSFYSQHLQRSYEDLERGVDTHMEGIFYIKLNELKHQAKIIFRFPCNVTPHGVPAHRAKSYASSSQQITNLIRGIARRLFPWWWI